ncbi:hypothetical protein SJI19_19245 [Acerihabitans sp. TG2]|uniref:hypothetical protein n=1 Tax=Acerihabitans sp. TG2 TaxID=3096008 RepID=UPI002B230616|nr:hypothetical protein [Acerihabitans sp. TG2]MEA9392645.1 hypothetical protein [Acerihabitans sp. TG2]
MFGFGYFSLRIKIAKVQAELMAQVHNQQFVNEICQYAETIELIENLFKSAYYRKRKDATFLIVCAVLLRTIQNESLPLATRKSSYNWLKERYEKIQTDRQYCIDNFLLVADFEYALEDHQALSS